MTRDDIIRMAKEARDQAPREDWNSTAWVFGDESLEQFATLAAAAGAAAEREACAKVCDLMEQQAEGTDCCKWPTPIDCAAAIRARGEKK